MKAYRVTHRATGLSHQVEAPSAQEACECVGWMIGECHVKEERLAPEPTERHRRAAEAAALVLRHIIQEESDPAILGLIGALARDLARICWEKQSGGHPPCGDGVA